MTIARHAPVRMDGQCLLAAGGEPLHEAIAPDAPETLRFGASHIEPAGTAPRGRRARN
jgi:hypothetical protein